MPFQTQVNLQPGVAEAGDFYGANPRASLIAGPDEFVTAAGAPLTVGQFVFVNPTTGVLSQTYANGDLVGFLHRENQGLITLFLAETTVVTQPGYPVTLLSQGDVWAKFAAGATPGAPVYASTTDGSAQTASAGGVLTSWVVGTVAAAGELAVISTWL